MAVFVLSTMLCIINPMAPRQRSLPRASAKIRRGRPQVHHETWKKVSVVLFDRQVAHLDRLLADMQRRSGGRLTRASVIRGLIDGLIASGADLSAAVSEGAVRDRIARLLRPGGRR